jgi:hypothetical protein
VGHICPAGHVRVKAKSRHKIPVPDYITLKCLYTPKLKTEITLTQQSTHLSCCYFYDAYPMDNTHAHIFITAKEYEA